MDIKLNLKLDVIAITILLFTTSVFMTETTKAIALSIFVLIGLFAYFKAVEHVSLLIHVVNSKFFIWFTSFLLFVLFDLNFRLQYGEFPCMLIPYLWGSVCVALIFMCRINDPSEFVSAICSAFLIAALGVVCYIAIMERELILIGNTRIGQSVSGNNVNAAGIALGIYSLGILFLYIQTKKKLVLISYILVVIFMLLTGSRKVIFPIVLGAAMYEACGGFRLRKFFVLIIAFTALVLLILNNSYMYNVIGDRVVSFLGTIGVIENSLRDDSTSIRSQLIMIAWQLFTEKPILGWGFNITARVVPWHFYSHNNYVELLANHGIVGFFMYYSMYIGLIWKVFKLPKKNNVRYFLLAVLFNSLFRDIGAVSYTSGLIVYISPMIASVYLMKEKRRMKYIAPKEHAKK